MRGLWMVPSAIGLSDTVSEGTATSSVLRASVPASSSPAPSPAAGAPSTGGGKVACSVSGAEPAGPSITADTSRCSSNARVSTSTWLAATPAPAPARAAPPLRPDPPTQPPLPACPLHAPLLLPLPSRCGAPPLPLRRCVAATLAATPPHPARRPAPHRAAAQQRRESIRYTLHNVRTYYYYYR